MSSLLTLSVSAIRHGTVIDHLEAGQALTIVRLLKLDQKKRTVTVGIHLTSDQLETKDIIKVEGHHLTPEEANQIALFSPYATVNIIDDYKVVKKYKVQPPESVSGVFRCPNQNCATNHHRTAGRYQVRPQRQGILLRCQYCEKQFPLREAQEC